METIHYCFSFGESLQRNSVLIPTGEPKVSVGDEQTGGSAKCAETNVQNKHRQSKRGMAFSISSIRFLYLW